MGASGQGSLSSAPKTNGGGAMPGPPFDPNSADNGVSVDPITGKIVFGNDTGGISARLLSNREVPMQGFDVTLTKPVGNILFSGGNQSGGITDVNTNNFYAAFTGLNRNTGNNAIAYSGVYNDLNNAMLMIAVGSNYNQGGTSYDANALMMYADSQGVPLSDFFIAGDANIHFLNGGLNSSFITASIFRASGNFRIANDGTDSFAARLQVRGDIDNIADFRDQSDTSQAAFSSVGNLILAQGAAFFDNGERLQIQTQATEPALSIQNSVGDRYAYMFANGNFRLGPGFTDNGQSLQIQAKSGQAPLYIETFSGGSQLAQMFSNGNLRIGIGPDSTGRLQVRGATAVPIADFIDSGNVVRFRINQAGDLSVTTSAGTGSALVKDGLNIVRHVVGFTGTVSPVTSITVVSGIVTAVS